MTATAKAHADLTKLLSQPPPPLDPIPQTGDCPGDAAACQRQLGPLQSRVKDCTARAKCLQTRSSLHEALTKTGVTGVTPPEPIDSQDCASDTKQCETDVSNLRALLGDCGLVVECNEARSTLYGEMKELADAMDVDLVPHTDIEIQTTCEAALALCKTDRTKMEDLLTQIDGLLGEEKEG